MKIGMILLAAGYSRRFGSNKLLYKIEGKSMYLCSLERLLEVQRKMKKVYLGPKEKATGIDDKEKIIVAAAVVTQYEEIQKNAESMGVQVILNPHPAERKIQSTASEAFQNEPETPEGFPETEIQTL